ncbi:MAG: cytochrome c [Acidimicrobiia bacterium]
MRLLVAILVATVIVSACSLGAPDEDATGEEIYAELCAHCHGADLSGGIGPPLGPGSEAAAETDEFLEFTIMNGRGRMPSFSSSLDENQLDRLIDFMRDGGGP